MVQLYISEPSPRDSGPILVCDEHHNDIAEFFHSEHATVPQDYETALSYAKCLVAGAGKTSPEARAREAEQALLNVMVQTESDLASAHAEICKLQNIDPARHAWPDWSPQANTLRWFKVLRDKFSLNAVTGSAA